MDNAPMHTPGPWHWNNPDRYRQFAGKFSGTAVYAKGYAFDWRIAEIQGPNKDTEIATARLIAAAPELLEHAAADVDELEYYVDNPSAWDSFDDGVSEMLRKVVTRARAAIAKATQP